MERATPNISVIIATHGRPDALADCLACLQQQTMNAGRYEVIVVDDGSPCSLEAAIAEKGAVRPAQCTFLRLEESKGPGGARNAGVALARGELLAFTDDDCLPAPDWLERLWAAHLRFPEAMLGGRLYNAVPEFLGAEASQVISDIVYAWYNRDPENGRFFSTNNAAVPLRMFLDVGAFNERFRGASEDRDLCDRWRFAGHKMVLVNDAVVGHAHRLTVSKFVRQHFSYGRGAATFHDERMTRGSGRIQDEMPFHKALPRLAAERLGKEPWGKRVALVGMIGMWQVANAAGYAWERVRGRRG